MRAVRSGDLHRRAMLMGAVAGGVISGGSAALPATGLPIPPGGKLSFRIMRKGNVIGAHESIFETNGDIMTMRAEVEIVVRILSIPLFRFTHSVVERWRGGQFSSLETRTNDDGKPYTVSVSREASGIIVHGSAQQRYTAPPEALPMTHWNSAEIPAPKIDPRNGDLLRPLVADHGLTFVPSVTGTIRARRYNFSGQATLDVWYDEACQWAALAFLGGDQSQITLERR
jgi:hypothetical protein